MTNKEAIDILWQYDVNFEPHPTEDIMHAIDMAIEALEAQERQAIIAGSYLLEGKDTNVPSNNTVSRQQVLDALDRFSLGETDVAKLTFRLRDYLMRLPSAESEIIRCKDCKHWSERFPTCNKTGKFGYGVNDFCSKAERKEQ